MTNFFIFSCTTFICVRCCEESMSDAWFGCDTFLSQTKRPIKRFNASIFLGLVIKYFYTVIETVFCTVICHIPLHLPWFMRGKEKEINRNETKDSRDVWLTAHTDSTSIILHFANTISPCWENKQLLKDCKKVRRPVPLQSTASNFETFWRKKFNANI